MSDPRKEFDTRVVAFHLRTGNITGAEQKTYLDSLPDDADEAVEVQVKFDDSYARRSEQDDTSA